MLESSLTFQQELLHRFGIGENEANETMKKVLANSLSEQSAFSDHATIFTAELLAISCAVDFIIKNKLENTIIVSDSRSVLEALNNPSNENVLIQELKEKIIHYKYSITLEWIRSHHGYQGNELADEYAKLAIEKTEIDYVQKFTKIQIKKILENKMDKTWQDKWDSSTKGRLLYQIYPKINRKRICGDFYLNQVLTTHGALAIYQQRFFGKSSVCPCGANEETRYHLIYDCTLWTEERKAFPTDFRSLSIRSLFENRKVKTIIRDIMEKRFLMEIKNL
ncbi:RNase H domain-containing protein [Caerostris darwini]|uniref:RNase H domain-containing protein n=1 Tax=Caerostris darwini TaxID=1538125 RepID=A0AAV4SRP6_9ARAC|nr:RNase H domain-containing protein [Caerostris darwini]